MTPPIYPAYTYAIYSLFSPILTIYSRCCCYPLRGPFTRCSPVPPFDGLIVRSHCGDFTHVAYVPRCYAFVVLICSDPLMPPRCSFTVTVYVLFTRLITIALLFDRFTVPNSHFIVYGDLPRCSLLRFDLRLFCDSGDVTFTLPICYVAYHVPGCCWVVERYAFHAMTR